MGRIHLQRYAVAGSFQPAERIRQGHHERVNGGNDIFRLLPIETFLPVQVIRILLLLQSGAGGTEGIREQFLCPRRFADGEHRIGPSRLEFLPDQMLAESMDRRDLHQVDPLQRLPYIFVLPLLPQAFADLLLHLGRGGIGERHDQESLRVGFLFQHTDHPLDHDGGLSAAGRGGADDPTGRRVDRSQLLVSPLRHGWFLLPSDFIVFSYQLLVVSLSCL